MMYNKWGTDITHEWKKKFNKLSRSFFLLLLIDKTFYSSITYLFESIETSIPLCFIGISMCHLSTIFLFFSLPRRSAESMSRCDLSLYLGRYCILLHLYRYVVDISTPNEMSCASILYVLYSAHLSITIKTTKYVGI